MPSLAFTADSRQTEAGRLYNRSEEDETRIPLQKAIDDADYEHGHRVNELDFLTAFRSPVAVARKSNCAFNTVRISSTGRPWIVDNDSRGGDDEHAQPNAELAKGRQVRMPCAPVDLTPWMDLERHRVALLNKNSRHGSTMCIRTTANTCY